MHYIIAHDLGTSGNKATLYDEHGKLLAASVFEYPTTIGKAGVVEQDADEWWNAVQQSTKKLLQISNIKNTDIACVSFSGQMMGCLPVDSDGSPLRPALIWADMRSENQANQLRTAVNEKQFYRIVGHRPISSYTLTKLMWVRDNEPEIYKRTKKTLQAKDYIVYKLTGIFSTDYSDASGTNAFDLVKKRWSNTILDAVGIREDVFPDPYPSTTVIGRVKKDAADLTGLAEGTPVVLGGGDGSCAIVGAGIFGGQKAYSILGSSSWIAFETDSPLYDEDMRYITWAHLDENKYQPCATMQAAGLSISWAKQALAGYEVYAEKQFGQNALELIEKEAQDSPAGSNNLLYLPYLLGERSPRWDPHAKGAFIGLTSRHTKQDIFRSVYEGIAYNLKTIINSFEAKVSLRDITLIGGGAKSNLWRQILADVWEKPILIPQYLEEATSMGAAVAGGIGVGLFDNFSIVEKLNPVVDRIFPETDTASIYRKLYPLFEDSYASLKEIFRKLGE
jgi:xylulokinase